MFGEAIRHVRDQLRAAGIHASADVKDIHKAGVWVTPASLTWDRLDDDTRTVTLDLNMIGPPSDALDALDALDLVLDDVRKVTDIRDVEAVTYPLPGRTLPGYRGQITVQVNP